MATGRKTGGRVAGTPNKITVSQGKGKTLTQLAQDLAPDALKVLREIMNDKQAPASARVSAVSIVFDRAYGKPKDVQPDGDDAPAPKVTIQVMDAVGEVRVTRSAT